MTTEINGSTFTLLKEKALYKHDERLLIIADVHLGKASHFRREGISMPAQAQRNDYTNLEAIIRKTDPLKVYFLGDLFHSSINKDWHYFCDLLALFPDVRFTLVKGNHDIIDHRKFREVCVDVTDAIEDAAFVYTHEPVATGKGQVNITGHVHPGYVLTGMGRQSVKLPCFYVTDTLVIVPAFGVLTGLFSMERVKGSRIFGVLPDCVERLV